MDENVTRIPLRNKQGEIVAFALIDAADEPLVVANGPWHHAQGYARHGRRVGPRSENRKLIIFMHRLILGLAPDDPRLGDHVNRDTLDNRRGNLRIVTAGLNAQNASPRRGSSAYRGVHWNKGLGKWAATAQVNRVTHRLGYFDNETVAAQVAREFRLANMPGATD